MKRLKIREAQLHLLIKEMKKSLVSESPMDKFLMEPEVGDIIDITTDQGSNLKFIVKSSIARQIIMMNSNKGSTMYGNYFFFSLGSVDVENGVITCKTINPNKLKDGEIINSVRTWKGKYTFNYISSVSIIRNGNVIDSLDGINQKNKKKKKKKQSEITDIYRDHINDILNMLARSSEKTNIIFEFDSGMIYSFEKINGTTPVEMSFVGGSENIPVGEIMYINILLPKDDSDVDILEFNKKIISINEDDTFNIVVKSDKDGKDLTIKNIKGIDFKKSETPNELDEPDEPDSTSTDDSDEKQPSNDSDSDQDDSVYMDKSEILNRILSDPTLKNAFYKSPKLLGMIKVGEPTGISAASKLISKWEDSGRTLDRKIYEKFRDKSLCKFKLDSDLTMEFPNGPAIQMSKDKIYTGRVSRGGGRIRISYPKDKDGNKIVFFVVYGKPNNRLEVKYGKINSDGDMVDKKTTTMQITNYNVDAIRV